MSTSDERSARLRKPGRLLAVALLALLLAKGLEQPFSALPSTRNVQASETAPAPRAGDAAARGETLYRRYCASCHGVSGAGDGPVAPVLEDAPADLRRLAERYGRPLPAARIRAFIDGRRPVDAHGDREMPVWGARFHDITEKGEAREARLRERISDLVAYLETIQLPPDRAE